MPTGRPNKRRRGGGRSNSRELTITQNASNLQLEEPTTNRGEFQTTYRGDVFKLRLSPCSSRDMEILRVPAVADLVKRIAKGVVVSFSNFLCDL